MGKLILARLIDLLWYWCIGYRFGDADGSGRLLNAIWYGRTCLRGWFQRRRACAPAAAVSVLSPARSSLPS